MLMTMPFMPAAGPAAVAPKVEQAGLKTRNCRGANAPENFRSTLDRAAEEAAGQTTSEPQAGPNPRADAPQDDPEASSTRPEPQNAEASEETAGLTPGAAPQAPIQEMSASAFVPARDAAGETHMTAALSIKDEISSLDAPMPPPAKALATAPATGAMRAGDGTAATSGIPAAPAAASASGPTAVQAALPPENEDAVAQPPQAVVAVAGDAAEPMADEMTAPPARASESPLTAGPQNPAAMEATGEKLSPLSLNPQKPLLSRENKDQEPKDPLAVRQPAAAETISAETTEPRTTAGSPEPPEAEPDEQAAKAPAGSAAENQRALPQKTDEALGRPDASATHEKPGNPFSGRHADRSIPARPDAAPLHAGEDHFRQNNLASIVERAAISMRGDHSEARIALKPDHLGGLRLQIATDNHMVSIRILAESPMARDLLESNVHHLKSEMAAKGIEVEKFDVILADNPRDFNRDAQQQLYRTRPRPRWQSNNYAPSENPDRDASHGFERGGRHREGIDFFV